MIAHNNLGAAFQAMGNLAAAVRHYLQAVKLNPNYANARYNLGNLLSALGRRDEAEREYRAGLQGQEQLVTEHPGVPEYAVYLGGSYCNLGILLRNYRQPAVELDWYDRAITTLGGVLRRVGRDVTALKFLRNSHWNRARALARDLRHRPFELRFAVAFE